MNKITMKQFNNMKIKHRFRLLGINYPRQLSRQKQENRFLMGFTLIEIIIAIGILSVGIVLVLSLFPKGLLLGREAKDITVASNLAQEKIEEYILKNYDEITVGITESRQRVDSDSSSPFYIYEREVLADYLDTNLNVSMIDVEIKKITVNMYWNHEGREKNIQLVRILNKK